MFEALRKKLTDTIKGFAKREETKSTETVQEMPAVERPETKPRPETEKIAITERQEAAPKVETKPMITEPKPAPKTEIEKPAFVERHETKPKTEIERPKIVEMQEEKRKVEPEKPTIAKKHETKPNVEVVKPAVSEKQEERLRIDLKLTTKIKSMFVKNITLSGKEIDGFADSMKEPMLRSDVAYSTTEEFVHDLKSQLAGTQIRSGKIDDEVTDVVRRALLQILNSGPKAGFNDLIAQSIAKGSAPVRILFLGPNGAGKTTTIAKLAYNLKMQGMSSILSASDTFRAAAIEQLEIHAKKIGVPIIKSKYGADPASVAFDAIAHAKSKGIQLVLIDSAGRQETNKSLISEIEKMVRVCKPDITIFIGESTAGNVISEQISEFGKHVHIDGIILTKLDCDAKGGSALSIAKTTGVPILFFGTGESYDALMPYSSEFIVDAILPAS